MELEEASRAVLEAGIEDEELFSVMIIGDRIKYALEAEQPEDLDYIANWRWLETRELVDGAYDDGKPVYGDKWADDNPASWAKAIAHGAERLAEAATAYREHGEWLQSLADEGWALTVPEDNGHLHLHWAGEGEPPAQKED